MSQTKDVSGNIHRIFYPKSVAVVGANNMVGTVPCDIFLNIIKGTFTGSAYPVSPRDTVVCDVKAYKYVTDIEGPVDLAIIVFASAVASMAVEQCGQKGVKSMIIISAGFKEVGEKGREKENELLAIADKHGISFIGPNCLGVINTDPTSMLNASFARAMPCEGNIAFLSQSGALCTAVLDFAHARHIGFSKFVSFGNKADISEIDLLRYLKDDPKTKVILLYLEEIRDGIALMNICKEIWQDAKKPVLLMKSGRTSQGASAASSHTGSLAGSDSVCDAAFKQAGIIRCKTIEEMFNKAIAFAYMPLPLGPRAAIITNAGGPGVLATDAAIESGLSLASFSEETTALFKKKLPVTANIKNPVDIIGDAHSDRYSIAINALLDEKDVDGVLVILTPQSMTDIEAIAEEIVKAAALNKKPVYASFMGEFDVAKGVDILRKANIPHYGLPEAMCEAFGATYAFAKQIIDTDTTQAVRFTNINKAAAAAVFDKAIAIGQTNLPQTEALKILQAYGIPTPAQQQGSNKEEVLAISAKIGFPVVFKIASEDIIHKSDAGGVLVNIKNETEADAAYDTIMKNINSNCPTARIDGILVVEMVTGGQEVILGVSKDPSFGGVVMFGLGGIFVEVLHDVSFAIPPLTSYQIGKTIKSIKSFPILSGVRGQKSRDIAAINECIGRLSQLALDFPQIQGMDINPLMVKFDGEGACAVDVRILL